MINGVAQIDFLPGRVRDAHNSVSVSVSGSDFDLPFVALPAAVAERTRRFGQGADAAAGRAIAMAFTRGFQPTLLTRGPGGSFYGPY